ncbi:DNA polymerase [Pseudomonas aeruginosa]|uniref:DNA polymerase n=1 Tax=Pseudomonas aeruginosa TaxID=287 RepID=UPI002F416F70
MKLIADCETDGLLHQLTKLHSLCLKDVDTGTLYSCADQPGYIPIADGVRMLMEADQVIFHNGIKFDAPAIQQVYPWFNLPIEKMRDTLVLTRLIWPEIGDRDTGLIRKGKLPGKLRGSHSLEAWGYRLGVYKGEFGKTSDWQVWTPEMQTYCEQDVEVTDALWKKIQSKEVAERAVELEHWFAFIIGLQERHGFAFDTQAAAALYTTLVAEREKLDAELKGAFRPWYVNAGVAMPKRPNRTQGIEAGVPYCKITLQEFNPASRLQIADRLTKLHGWKPQEFTEGGQPKVDETVLSKLPYPAAKLLARRFLIEKRIGQLAEGNQAWLKLERKGRIHGSVNTIGAVTGRCTHSHPNVAQVPSVRAPFGKECRALFGADPGYVQIGADASGLELRCLAHYMARYDGGAYAKVLLEGDIHTENQKAAGLPTRDNAKTFIYAYLYGAGDEKIGQIVGKGAKEGKKLKENFLKRTPALKRLREDVASAVKKRGYLVGIDGRHLHIRSDHAALNTLLQSAGALLVKQATVNLYRELSTRGYVFGKDWAMLAHVHDEYQLQARKEIADEVAQVAVWAFQQAGRDFNWRCPLDGEAKTGTNWAECH